MTVEDYMTQDPMTVTPDTNIEDAALTIYENKIGALPVVQNSNLVGIISIMDMLGLFVDMMGILHSSSRIDVEIGDNPKNLEKVIGIIKAHDLTIISASESPHDHKTGKTVYSFRLDLCETDIVVKKIERAGFNVLVALD
ncbi:hypothetical protein UZ36_02800 [Candidatus Nitromaritima sp. SCGC AAA799-C22]|nr:hypothetical protein UZ36_02800 [Candidatus Nitromaritima sp. SCGC AAA799-C22]